ncbi:hypothetical protein Glove_92g18 [Diversispora epigaea]|uniref:Uncharacterized protein n=1 Tax=Diversispora epigaea TaxID=1348612 RepID=A0A397J594_9GLOM|nr:hypothetical protein Glove_92g18 [Diversispora epigaea]
MEHLFLHQGHRKKYEDVEKFWRQIESEISIDLAETQVACEFIHRSASVVDTALINVEEKMKQNRKRVPYSPNVEGECSTRKSRKITCDSEVNRHYVIISDDEDALDSSNFSDSLNSTYSDNNNKKASNINAISDDI